MFDYRITFGAPWFLLLLAGLPLVWWFSYRRLAALGPVRRWVAILLRSLVLSAFILALAEIQAVRISERLTVIYLLDQSLSIPVADRQQMIRYVNAAIREHRRGEDRAGVIVFGKDAAIEIPPFEDDIQVPMLVESMLDPEHTNLEAALRLAQASFPEDSARRIVIVSDGNETLGDSLAQARALAGAGVGIDVVPVRYENQGEVIVERVATPNDVRRGEPFDLKVVLNNPQDPGREAREVSGRLVVRKRLGEQSVVVSEETVRLPPGKQVFSVRQEADDAGFYVYEATFTPDRREDDAMLQNNRATAFAHVRGRGQVLLIESYEQRGQYDRLVQGLRNQNIEVVVRPSDQAFDTLADLQQYDTIVLANVPRDHLTDGHIDMLVRNTQQLGAGLIMLGAPHSFGAGGWANTELERAMPVDFQIKNAKIVPQGALAMIFHATEMAQGNYWQKIIAREALNALGALDYCGVIHYGNMSGRTEWLWKPGMAQVGNRRREMLSRLGRMDPGDMPEFDPGMVMALNSLQALPGAAVKHMIIISDGDAARPNGKTVTALQQARITVSTVAVATHGGPDQKRLRDIALATGGKFYNVTNANALPRIFQREARKIAKPLVHENNAGIQPNVRFPHEMISGVERFPPITGYVLTTRKENPLVEVSVVAPEPADPRNTTLLASWTYGLGKAVAFTTDAGARYTSRWTGWEDYDKLFGQIVRWSMRPVDEAGKFIVASDVQDEQVQVVVTALDKDDEFLNFLDMTGTVVGPDLKPVPMKMEQTAPGRYVGTFPADDAGSYFMMVSPGAGRAPIRTGIDVPYSDEFRTRATNESLLKQAAELPPKGGSPGRVIEAPPGPDETRGLLAVNSFRHDLPRARHTQDAWFYLVLIGSCLFFFDVFIRRVQVGFAWVPMLAGRARDKLLGRQPAPPEPPTMERLRSRKAEVGSQLEQLRASTRFEASPGTPADLKALEAPEAGAAPPAAPQAPTIGPQEQQESYTERLLKAKKKAWDEKNPGK